MRNIISKIFFDFSWLLLVPIFKIFLHYHYSGRKNLKNLKGPTIIAANHVSFIDGFLLGAAFPFNSRLFPLSFAVDSRYYFFFLFRPVLWLYSSFPIFRKIGLDKSLRYPIRLLQKGGTVVIFPEGRIKRKKDQVFRAGRGVAYMANKTGAPILPVKIKGPLNLNPKMFLSRKANFSVCIGEPFKISDYYKSLEKDEELFEAANFVMEKVYNSC